MAWRTIIYRCLVTAFQTFLRLMEEQGVDFEDSEVKVGDAIAER